MFSKGHDFKSVPQMEGNQLGLYPPGEGPAWIRIKSEVLTACGESRDLKGHDFSRARKKLKIEGGL